MYVYGGSWLEKVSIERGNIKVKLSRGGAGIDFKGPPLFL
jgi:hypothetical protein